MTAYTWEQQDGEPSRWYGRFEVYRRLGAERTLVAAYNAWRKTAAKPPVKVVQRDWRRMAQLWRWRERAEAWDRYEAGRLRALFAEEAVAEKRERIDLLKAFRVKVVQALVQLDIADARWADVIAALRYANEALAREYEVGDGPSSGETHDGRRRLPIREVIVQLHPSAVDRTEPGTARPSPV